METAPRRRATDTGAPGGGKFLTFTIGREEYGLPVLKVREIIKVMDITHVPQVAAHVLGVINLRGRVIPVIDLRRKFGFDAQPHTERTCIIVAEVALPSSTVMMGIVVDAVSEVMNVTAAEIEQPPDFGGQRTNDYLRSLAKGRRGVKILLDRDRVLGSEGPVAINAA